MRHSFSIYFYLKRRKLQKDSKSTIMLRIIVNNKATDVSLKTSILQEHWDKQNKRVSAMNPEAHEINAYLDKVSSTLQHHYQQAQLEGKQSMMNNDGEAQPMSGHVGHTMSGHEGHAAHGTSAAQPEPAGEHAMFGVKGSCDMCKQRIETAAKNVNGVSSVHWDKEKQMIHLQYNPSKTSVDAISKAIAKAGHDTDTYKADQTSTTNCRVVANTGNKRILQPGQATSPSSPLLSFFILVAIFGRA